MTDGLLRAAVIGRDEIDGKTYHHLTFGEKEADWQIWVEAGSKPVPRRVQIVYKTLRREPRLTIDFFDWNLTASPPANYFVFQKPLGARYIDFLEATSANPQSVLAQISRRVDTPLVNVQNRSSASAKQNEVSTGTIHDYDWDWSSFAIGGAAANPSIAVVAPPVGTVVATLPSGCTDVAEASAVTYNCKGVYYRPFYQGSTLVYRVTAVP